MLWGEIVSTIVLGLVVALIIAVVRFALRLRNRGRPESGQETVAVQQLPEAPRRPRWFLEAEEHRINERYSKAVNKYRLGLDKEPSRRDRAIIMGKIAYCYRRLGDFQRALEYWRKCHVLAREVEDDALAGHSAKGLGEVLHRTGQLSEAKRELSKAKAMFERQGDKHAVVDTEAMIGQVLLNEGKHKQAEELFKRSLRYHWLRGPDLGAADAREKLGALYQRQRRFSRSLRNLRKARRTYLKHKIIGPELQILNTIGVIKEAKGDLENAMRSYGELLQRAREYDHLIFEGMALQNLASAYLKKGELEDARLNAEAARAVFSRAAYPWGELKSLNLLAILESVQGNTENAEGIINEALELAEKCGFPKGDVEDLRKALDEYGRQRAAEKEEA